MKARSKVRRSHSSSNTIAFPASVDSLCDLVGDLKEKVARRLNREYRERVPGVLIRRAVDEAAETAFATDFPHLFLPELAEEKVRLVSTAVEHSRLPHAA